MVNGETIDESIDRVLYEMPRTGLTWSRVVEIIEEVKRLRTIVDAARFIPDFADDMGTCACCDHGIGKSDEADGESCDCLARLVREAFRKYDKVTKK